MFIEWREAKTYREIAPHKYILKEDYPDLFDKYKSRIEEDGINEKFTLFGHTKIYRYLYSRGYKYWIIENVLNRGKI